MTSVFAEVFAAAAPHLLSTFGEPVELQLEGQAEPIPARGIFTARHQEVDPESGMPISAVQPMAEVWAPDLPAQPTEGDQISLRGTTYLIVDCQPDGHGFLRLLLHRT
ncbi:hypothetical protein U5801_21480 [Lamprobacter modestohalophilus]|uniref:head-tail joining protein n=1 Tax=Lamprobacter modestohalophilus TaxID=1064514 RepID=UPI002ADECDEC|nr:hypothetical protein [Lamprobacter modestohalophilus]MEA1052357.1 hypothetical protein [Lamprobacter modestohalophilus]